MARYIGRFRIEKGIFRKKVYYDVYESTFRISNKKIKEVFKDYTQGFRGISGRVEYHDIYITREGINVGCQTISIEDLTRVVGELI